MYVYDCILTYKISLKSINVSNIYIHGSILNIIIDLQIISLKTPVSVIYKLYTYIYIMEIFKYNI